MTRAAGLGVGAHLFQTTVCEAVTKRLCKGRRNEGLKDTRGQRLEAEKNKWGYTVGKWTTREGAAKTPPVSPTLW